MHFPGHDFGGGCRKAEMTFANRAMWRHFQPGVRRRRNFGRLGVEDEQHAWATAEEKMPAVDLAEQIEAEHADIEFFRHRQIGDVES